MLMNSFIRSVQLEARCQTAIYLTFMSFRLTQPGNVADEPFSAISSSDNLRLGLGLGSVLIAGLTSTF